MARSVRSSSSRDERSHQRLDNVHERGRIQLGQVNVRLVVEIKNLLGTGSRLVDARQRRSRVRDTPAGPGRRQRAEGRHAFGQDRIKDDRVLRLLAEQEELRQRGRRPATQLGFLGEPLRRREARGQQLLTVVSMRELGDAHDDVALQQGVGIVAVQR